jgi:hypothetical protein
MLSVIPFSCCLLIVSFCCLEADYLNRSFPNIIVVVVVGCRPWLSEAARGRILGDECKRLDLCWPQWVHFGSQEHHRTSWNSMESHGTSWNLMEPHGIPQNLMESHRTSWNLTEPHGISQNLVESHGRFWNMAESSGC